MGTTCLALQSAHLLRLVLDFIEEVKECELLIPVLIEYKTCVHGSVLNDSTLLWNLAKRMLSEVQLLFGSSMSELRLDEIGTISVL